LNEQVIDGQPKQGGNENSSSLDDLEFLVQDNNQEALAPTSAGGHHRRARSSLGANRKASAKGGSGANKLS
jgi:hypothetical protein